VPTEGFSVDGQAEIGRPSMSKKKGTIHTPRVFRVVPLKKVLKRMQGRLLVKKVPKVRLPTNDALISLLQARLSDWLDWAKVNEWLDSQVDALL
jgi:hypothetical protein